MTEAESVKGDGKTVPVIIPVILQSFEKADLAIEKKKGNHKRKATGAAAQGPPKHKDCERCNAPRKEGANPSHWHAFLREFTSTNPKLTKEQARERARMIYVPESGKKKTFDKLYTMLWMSRHPGEMLTKQSDEEIRDLVRKSFINENFATP